MFERTPSGSTTDCILDLLETIAPDLQITTHRPYAIKQIATYNSFTVFRYWQLPARVWSYQSSVSRCIGAVSKRYGFLFSTSRRTTTSFPVQFSFFVFKFVGIVCVLLYTSVTSLHVIKHVVFCVHMWTF